MNTRDGDPADDRHAIDRHPLSPDGPARPLTAVTGGGNSGPRPIQVWCFDRDHTVDVNPHPDRRAVPLQWVQRLGGQPGHVVLATGNRYLKDEAEIPGVDELVAAWEQLDPADRVHAEPGRWSYPMRRKRIRMAADLFPNTPVTVVDDVDLSDIEDTQITHYLPWDFVDAVEDGDIELPLDVASEPGVGR